MSGFAFQKLNGSGTKMQELIDSVNLGNKSDLYKLAREHYPNSNLIPINDSWEIGVNENAINDLSLGGLYFGKWIINHNSQDVGDSDNSRKRSQSFLKFGDKVVARTMILIHGDDILAWKTATTEHLGSATSLHVHKLEADDQPQHGVQVSFIGYKISNSNGFVYPSPSLSIDQTNGNIVLSASDLSNLGYSYQWSVTTGTGTFVNPNIPNAVFVPDGNGNYVFQLVVTDNDGNVSTPVTVDHTRQIVHMRMQAALNELEYYDGDSKIPIIIGDNYFNVHADRLQYFKNIAEYDANFRTDRFDEAGGLYYTITRFAKQVLDASLTDFNVQRIYLWRITLVSELNVLIDIPVCPVAEHQVIDPVHSYYVLEDGYVDLEVPFHFSGVANVDADKQFQIIKDEVVLFTSTLGAGSFDFSFPFSRNGGNVFFKYLV